MFIFKLLFFFGLALVFYSYLGYGIILWLINKIFVKKTLISFADSETEFLPAVTLVIAAFNEEDFITKKIENSFSLDYPQEKLKILIITDGSSDKTPEIVNQYPGIIHMHEPIRAGKIAAIHRAMANIDTPYVIFSDANTLLNKMGIRNIVRHYKDISTGGVAGEKKIITSDSDTIAGSGEGLYWKYESFLKNQDGKFYSVVGAAGELFSIKTGLYEFPGKNIILDDLIISMRICQKGYRIAYEPDAYAMETPSASIKEERKRKVRISAGAFQSIVILYPLLNVFKFPKLAFQYISHRVLRWTLCPLFLPIILITNIILLYKIHSSFYTLLLVFQCLFYIFALAGWVLSKVNIRIGVLYAFYYFLFINISLYTGFVSFLKGRQSVLWEKAARKKDPE